jgi:surfeit locus 1 family protein
MAASKPLLGAGFAAAAGVLLLTGLGVWQLYRLEWKTALLDRIAASMAAVPLELALDADAVSPRGAEEYRRVCAEGTFHNDRELYFFVTNLQGDAGFHIVTPLEREGGTAVLVDRGWVPPARKDPATRREGLVQGVVRVCGIVVGPENGGLFAPDNDPAGNLWYVRAPKEMAAAASLATPNPLFINADETPNPGGLPIGGQTRVDIPNNHLGYAITWFGLALALVGVFSVFAWQRRHPST